MSCFGHNIYRIFKVNLLIPSKFPTTRFYSNIETHHLSSFPTIWGRTTKRWDLYRKTTQDFDTCINLMMSVTTEAVLTDVNSLLKRKLVLLHRVQHKPSNVLCIDASIKHMIKKRNNLMRQAGMWLTCGFHTSPVCWHTTTVGLCHLKVCEIIRGTGTSEISSVQI